MIFAVNRLRVSNLAFEFGNFAYELPNLLHKKAPKFEKLKRKYELLNMLLESDLKLTVSTRV